MVKVEDLGYISSNLQDIPSKEEDKEKRYQRALANLTSEKPEKLSPIPLPESLLNFGRD